MRRNHKVPILLSKDEKDDLEKIADEHGLSISAFIRFVLKEHIMYDYKRKEEAIKPKKNDKKKELEEIDMPYFISRLKEKINEEIQKKRNSQKDLRISLITLNSY